MGNHPKISPDYVKYNGKVHEYNDLDAFPFAILRNGYVLWGHKQQTHMFAYEDWCEENMTAEDAEEFERLDRRKQQQFIYAKVKELAQEIIFEGRYFVAIPAITYWPYDRSDDDWDNPAPLNLTAQQLCRYVEKIRQSRTSLLNIPEEELMIQWNDELIPLSQLQGSNGESNNDDELRQQRAIHLASAEEKREKMGNYLKNRSSRQGEKLYSRNSGKEMTQAEYHNLTTIGDSVSKIGNKVNEDVEDEYNYADPDGISYGGYAYTWDYDVTYPFIIFDDDTIMYGDSGETHSDVITYKAEEIGTSERVVYSHVKYEGRVYDEIEAITYWRGEKNFDDSKSLSKSEVKFIADKVISTMNGYTPDETLVQWNNKLYKYSELFGNDNDEELSIGDDTEKRAIHLADQETKRQKMGDYLTNRSKNQSDKLQTNQGEMSTAEYNALRRPYSENKVYTKGQIEKRIDEMTSINARKDRKVANIGNFNKPRRVFKITEDAMKTFSKMLIEYKLKK